VSGPVIELGSYQGRSTVLFALAGRQVHAVDAWSVQAGDSDRYYLPGGVQPETSLALFQRNLRAAQVEARVSVHQGHTHDVGRTWGSPAAIVFVDAGHSYADARGDIDIWSPHLHPGGVLIMHDVLSYVHLDVARVASELIREDWRVVASAGSLVAFVRKDRKHA
jgi:predicted O-methyltransferase YrrM